MNTNLSTAVTVEEAVALLINLDYVPAGFSVTDMTSAFLEEAVVEYDNSRIDRATPHIPRMLRRNNSQFPSAAD